MRDDAESAGLARLLQKFFRGMRRSIAPSGIHSEHHEVPVRCADFLTWQDDNVVPKVIEPVGIKGDVVLSNSDEVEMRVAGGLKNTFQSSTTVMTNARVDVKDPDHLTRSAAAQVVQWEMSEVAVKQNAKPEDQKCPNQDPAQSMRT